METLVKDITVRATINAPVERVWEFYTNPFHVLHWNSASQDWITPYGENNLAKGEKFLYRMESKDGSQGFDFSGTYDDVMEYKYLSYRLDDGRKVRTEFRPDRNMTTIIQTFEPEHQNTPEMQQQGWQAILDNFKRYVENWKGREVLHYEMYINAPVSKVYKALYDKTTHAEWTSVFNPTSRYEGSWEKGSKITFLGDDPSGGEGGMICSIRENIPNKFISVEYLGMIRNGNIVTTGKDIEWIGMMENYTIKDVGGKTILSIDADTTEDFRDYFAEHWPKALSKLKEICERQ